MMRFEASRTCSSVRAICVSVLHVASVTITTVKYLSEFFAMIPVFEDMVFLINHDTA
jgi:hypothetical protein